MQIADTCQGLEGRTAIREEMVDRRESDDETRKTEKKNDKGNKQNKCKLLNKQNKQEIENSKDSNTKLDQTEENKQKQR